MAEVQRLERLEYNLRSSAAVTAAAAVVVVAVGTESFAVAAQ